MLRSHISYVHHCMPQFSLSYNLSLSWQAQTFSFKNNLPDKSALKLNFGSKFYKPFWFKASACRHGEFIERTGAKTIANVRTVDECVKRMNGVFSLENTESEYKVLFASKACIKTKLWFKVL